MISAAPDGAPPRRINEKETEPALAPPCPERGPEAGRPHTRSHYFKPLYAELKRHGFSKGALHYMKKNAEGDQPITLNKCVMTRVDQWDQGADQVG